MSRRELHRSMKRKSSQSEREFRAGFGQVQNRAAAANSDFSERKFRSNLQRTSSLSSLREGDFSNRCRVPSEGNLRQQDYLAGELASLDISHDSGVWAGDSTLKRDCSIQVCFLIAICCIIIQFYYISMKNHFFLSSINVNE